MKGFYYLDGNFDFGVLVDDTKGMEDDSIYAVINTTADNWYSPEEYPQYESMCIGDAVTEALASIGLKAEIVEFGGTSYED